MLSAIGRENANDPNLRALNDFRLLWAQNAVASRQVNPRFFPTYTSIMNIPLPNANMTSDQFEASATQLTNAIKLWYTNSRYSGNLVILGNEIDRTRPRFTPPRPTPTTTSTTTSTTTPTTTPTTPPGSSPQTLAVANRFFKSAGGVKATVDFAAEFDNFKSISDADIIDINNLITTSTSTTNFNSIADKLRSEGNKIRTEIQGRRKKVEAINQQFVDDKLTTGSVSKSKVMVLQDYILAGFAIAYLFFAIVVIFYFTKYSEKPLRSFVTLSALMVVVSAILYTWTSYLA